jgi:hypothetical protein
MGAAQVAASFFVFLAMKSNAQKKFQFCFWFCGIRLSNIL